jgi:hypothetical protein
MPSEPVENNFKDKIRLKAYPTTELGGLIWAYLGPVDKKPPEPRFPWTQLPETQRRVTKTWQESNWLQAVEGGLDTVHPAFLHRNLTTKTSRAGISPANNIYMSSAGVPKIPKLDVELTDYGFIYTSIIPVNERDNLVVISNFIMPVCRTRVTTSGGEVKQSMVEGHMCVPIDDENCMDYVFRYCFGADIQEMQSIENDRGRGLEERTSEFRKVRNKSNNWLIDRQIQKSETFTGIDGINTQDQAVQESMGNIVDRSLEHLGSSDRVIIAARRYLLTAAAAQEKGSDPPGIKSNYETIFPRAMIIPRDVQWRDALARVEGAL